MRKLVCCLFLLVAVPCLAQQQTDDIAEGYLVDPELHVGWTLLNTAADTWDCSDTTCTADVTGYTFSGGEKVVLQVDSGEYVGYQAAANAGDNTTFERTEPGTSPAYETVTDSPMWLITGFHATNEIRVYDGDNNASAISLSQDQLDAHGSSTTNSVPFEVRNDDEPADTEVTQTAGIEFIQQCSSDSGVSYSDFAVAGIRSTKTSDCVDADTSAHEGGIDILASDDGSQATAFRIYIDDSSGFSRVKEVDTGVFQIEASSRFELFLDFMSVTYEVLNWSMTTGQKLQATIMPDSPGGFRLSSAYPLEMYQSGDIAAGDFIIYTTKGNAELTDTDGQQAYVSIRPEFSQSGTAAATALEISATNTSLGDGSTGNGNFLIEGLVGGSPVFDVDMDGDIHAKSLRFNGFDSDSGFYEATDDQITVELGGAADAYFRTDRWRSATGNSWFLDQGAGTYTNPNYASQWNDGSGVAFGDASSVSLTANFVEGLRVSESSGDIAVSTAGSFTAGTGTIAADDTTPSVAGANWWTTSDNTGATAITDLDDPVVGTMYTICIGGTGANASTITDGGNFNIAGNWTPGLDDCITICVQADNNYIECIPRVNN